MTLLHKTIKECYNHLSCKNVLLTMSKKKRGKRERERDRETIILLASTLFSLTTKGKKVVVVLYA